MSFSQKALHLLRYLPRVSFENVERSPYAKPLPKRKCGSYSEKKKKRDMPRFRLQTKYLPVGFNFGKTPIHKKFPIENYYKDIEHRRHYSPLSLHSLQMMIDSKLIKENEPIDLASVCNTQHFKVDPFDNCYGIHLTDEGIDLFEAKINIEVQHASEHVIAAIEKNGGTITTAYYDLDSIIALHDPYKFFLKGDPIPKRQLPPLDKIDYYTNAKNRGYLADPEKISEERFILSQKYGYVLPNLNDQNCIYKIRKDPRQVFFGLEPGWVINLKDKEILIPEDEELIDFYKN